MMAYRPEDQFRGTIHPVANKFTKEKWTILANL